MKEYIIKSWKKSGVKISVFFTIVLILLSTSISFYKQQVLQTRNEIRDDMEKVRSFSDQYNLILLCADVGVRGYYMIPEKNFLTPFDISKTKLINDTDGLKLVLSKYNFEIERIDSLTEYMQDYFVVLDNMVNQKTIGQEEAVLETFASDPGLTVYHQTMPTVTALVDFSRETDEKSLARYNRINRFNVIFQWMLLILGLPVLIIMIIKITRNENKRQVLFDKLNDSDKQFIFNSNDKSEVEIDQSTIIDRIINNLQKATKFIQNITEGNYSIDWEGMNDELKEVNKTNISGELLKMRDQMIKVKNEDTMRLWSTEGTSKFAEIIRVNENDIKTLSEVIISEMVKYLKANQGGLFLLNDDDQNDSYLELVSCYAYERKKYQERRIEIGQTLVGQVFLEKKSVIMTQVPDEYVRITSGLGNSTPKCIIIIPMLFKDNVVGIIELASFKEYEEHEVNLLEKLSEIIAAAVNNAKTVDRTNKLLDSSKEYEEQMRSQEEEMRQNMEEMVATQEEMKRKTDGFESKIDEQEITIKELKEQLSESISREEKLKSQDPQKVEFTTKKSESADIKKEKSTSENDDKSAESKGNKS